MGTSYQEPIVALILLNYNRFFQVQVKKQTLHTELTKINDAGSEVYQEVTGEELGKGVRSRFTFNACVCYNDKAIY